MKIIAAKRRSLIWQPRKEKQNRKLH
ncbi:hypothetical protein BIW11_11751 [Tropilaelaps mercedesae]|uniref:Uncharacterized protein n=1 Tax=Tropilaelaps mercedesae TaxID=418985 RepID=A0A1V9XA53_9ACAR|nr:hypothetical protein BIW11_11751 [Tropilaelaps mercedesae]